MQQGGHLRTSFAKGIFMYLVFAIVATRIHKPTTGYEHLIVLAGWEQREQVPSGMPQSAVSTARCSGL